MRFPKDGRNLLNFQKIELMLKYIIANGRLSGFISELTQNKERQASKIHKTMMGNLLIIFLRTP